MSRKWNIRCTSCFDGMKQTREAEATATLYLGEGSNHNEERAVAVAKAALALAVLGKAAPETEVAFDLAVRVPSRWFTAHEGHKLVVVDEYGELSDNYWPEDKA